jgi:hypothetical protein
MIDMTSSFHETVQMSVNDIESSVLQWQGMAGIAPPYH